MSLEDFTMKRVRRQFTVELKKMLSASLLTRKDRLAKSLKASIFRPKH